MNDKKILIVDDSDELSKMEAKTLIKKGFQVEIARDGKEGMEKIINEVYDLVILDLVLPEKTGYEILNEVQRLEIETPIIVHSSMWEGTGRKEAIKLGAKEFIEKGIISLDTFVEKIERILTRMSTDQTEE